MQDRSAQMQSIQYSKDALESRLSLVMFQFGAGHVHSGGPWDVTKTKVCEGSRKFAPFSASVGSVF